MIDKSVVVSAGSAFAVSSDSGDILPGTPQGFYASDTRFLSSYRLTLNGRRPTTLDASSISYALASFYQNSMPSPGFTPGAISITRDRYVAHGLHDDITLANHGSTTKTVRLELTFDADFADVFDARMDRVRKLGRITLGEREGQHISLVYRRGSYVVETWISFTTEPTVRGKKAVFQVTLRPKETWTTCLTILPVTDEAPPPMVCAQEVLGPPFGVYQPAERPPFEALLNERRRGPIEDVPTLETDYALLRDAYDQAISDLRALSMEQPSGHYLFAAGLPWYMALFGRDSIISSIQTKLLGPELMVGTLHTLSLYQATARDDFRDAQPGKIPHEVRRGELSFLKHVPHARYYGSVDSTPLFIVLLAEAYQWTGDREFLLQMLPAAEAALRWIDRFADLDGDGFIEYQRRSQQGLRNQGWKDTRDAISFADGTLAEGPIALAEVQGYVYDAKTRLAGLYRELGRTSKARSLENAAQRLQRQFNEAFWMDDKGYFAVALDGRKRRVDSVTSNPGHCLWSGIVDRDKAGPIVERLMAPDMFSGWGIRTMSSEMSRYHPVSYHNGSIWPHDNSLIAAGFARYGFHREAGLVASALIDASGTLPEHRLPELYSGYPRRQHSFPVSYPMANAPQAWASGAVIHLLETLLGIRPGQDRLLQEEVPREGRIVSLTGVRFRGSRQVLGDSHRRHVPATGVSQSM